jgi:hypothetical protein
MTTRKTKTNDDKKEETTTEAPALSARHPHPSQSARWMGTRRLLALGEEQTTAKANAGVLRFAQNDK